MADQKVSDLPALSGADVDAADLLYIVDSSAGSAGSKKITVGQYQLAPVSGGTANGVMYLDGSKVVTTGSDLVFDGTNLGIGTISPGAKLEVASGKVLLSNTQSYAIKTSAGSSCDVVTLTSGNVLQLGGGGATDSIQFWNQGVQRMTLDSSGNLGLGVTPGTWAAAAKALDFTYPAFGMDGNGAAFMSFNARNSTGSTWVYKTTDEAGKFTVTTGGGFTWETAASGTAGDPISFGDPKMTLDVSGNLLVGTTTLSAVGNSIFGSSVPGVIHQNNNAASNGFVFTSYRRSSVEIGSVSQNGTTAVLFNTTSDRRLKTNIAPSPSASAVIDAIEIVSHDWKSAPDEHVTYGVIAQDLALVAPQAVLQGDDGDEIEKTWGVDYSKLVPMLIKEIQSLRARVAALESA